MQIKFATTLVAYLFLSFPTHTDALIPPELHCSLPISLLSVRSTAHSMRGIELVSVDAVPSLEQSSSVIKQRF